MIRAATGALLLLLSSTFPVAASEDLVPSEIGGAPAQVSALSGLRLVAGLDPGDERDLQRIDELETLLAVTGQPIDAVSAASAYPAAGAEGGWVIALRVAGADAAVLQALLLSGVREDLEGPSQSTVEMGGKTVILVDDAVTDGAAILAIYGRDDTVWLLGGTDEEVAELLDQLP